MAENLKSKRLAFPEGAKGNFELSVDANVAKTTFAFPQKAELAHGKHQFKSPDELKKYMAQSLGLNGVSDRFGGSVCQRGKYQKVSKSGSPVVTIGDPILDLISDDEGRVFIGKDVIHLTDVEFGCARYRSGGIRSIDLANISGALAQDQLLAAARGEGSFVLLEASDRAVAFASTNPSQRDFYPTGGGHLRFKAWRKNYSVYWSIGAEIETWGGNFKSARIDSVYIDTFYAQTCIVVKRDSDSDTNDDYVDEYEWGSFSSPPKRVESFCTARFKNQDFSGSVQAGEQCFTLG